MIKGKNIILRPIKEVDLDTLFQLENSIRLRSEFLPFGIDSEYLFKKKFQQTGFWEKDFGVLLIVDNNDKIIGCLWFQKIINFDALDLGYIIFKREDQGKGVMTESLKLFSSYLFALKKINRLQVLIPDYNRASISVSQKCGFTFEGIKREAYFSNGKYLDLCIYSMLRKECSNIERLF